MSDIKLFQLNGDAPKELTAQSVAVEKSLQNLLESHLEVFLAVRMLASEHLLAKTPTGTMSSPKCSARTSSKKRLGTRSPRTFARGLFAWC